LLAKGGPRPGPGPGLGGRRRRWCLKALSSRACHCQQSSLLINKKLLHFRNHIKTSFVSLKEAVTFLKSYNYFQKARLFKLFGALKWKR